MFLSLHLQMASRKRETPEPVRLFVNVHSIETMRPLEPTGTRLYLASGRVCDVTEADGEILAMIPDPHAAARG